MLQDGSTQLLCLTASSGVPLFIRGGFSRQLPFSVIGSLNGVHMFGGGQGALLSCCETEDGGRIVWRVFQDSVMLIAVCSSGRSGSCSSSSSSSREMQMRLQRLLENVWSCMVLVLGQDELVHVRNVERLKKDLRSCFGLIDQLIEDRQEGLLGNLTHCADSLLPPDPSLLQEAVDGFTEAADSEFGCLIVHGRIVTATEKWWRLAPVEIVLLLALLLPGADVCVLCGPTPSLHKVEAQLLSRFWLPLVDTLRDCLDVGERCFPGAVPLRPDVLALLLINRDTRRSVSCAQSSSCPSLPKARRWELLKLFYIFTVSHYFSQEEASEETDQKDAAADFLLGFSHQPQHCYLVMDECKSYGLQTPQHQLYLLLAPSVPTYALRTIAMQTLSDIRAATKF
uniref:Fuzzy planar cell polarity protein n=1 Tax=Oryzias sinensis TaxID=183150 RepID=A0A8C7X028_9TELE